MSIVNIYDDLNKQTIDPGESISFIKRAASSTRGFDVRSDSVGILNPGPYRITFRGKIAALTTEVMLAIQFNGRTLSGLSKISTNDTSFLPFTAETTVCVPRGCRFFDNLIEVRNIGTVSAAVEDVGLIIQSA